jgi:hypothetical protein
LFIGQIIKKTTLAVIKKLMTAPATPPISNSIMRALYGGKRQQSEVVQMPSIV